MFAITTPAILFPAISLILLAYTAKLAQLGSLVRSLKNQYLKHKNPEIPPQVANIKKRIYLIRNMQVCGILSFICGVLCMLALFAESIQVAKYCFSISLIFLLVALLLSFREITLSANALKIVLKDWEEK